MLAIDQGRTLTRVIVFDDGLRPVAPAQEGFPQHYPNPGCVPEDL